MRTEGWATDEMPDGDVTREDINTVDINYRTYAKRPLPRETIKPQGRDETK